MKIASGIFIFDGCIEGPDDPVLRTELFGGTRFKYADLSMPGLNNAFLYNDDKYTEWPDKTMAAAEQSNIKFIQAHSMDCDYYDESKRGYTLGLIKRQIDICGRLGIPQIVVHAVYRKGNTWKEFREANECFYNSLTDSAERNGVAVLLENGCYKNTGGNYYLLSAELILETINDLKNHPLFNVCWDTGHAHLQGVNQYKEIMELGSRLKGLHIHDNDGNSDLHQAPFLGNCNFDDVIRGLIDSGYGGYFTLEAYPAEPAGFPFIKRRGYDNKNNSSDRLIDLPSGLVIKAADLMYDVAAYMLSRYGCYEE